MKKSESSILEKSLKVIAKSSFFVFVIIFISKLLSYIYRIIIARYFDPEVYGLFSLSLMVASWFLTAAALGLNSGIERYISFYRGRKEFKKIKYLLKWSTIFLTITSVIAWAVLFLGSRLIATYVFKNPNLEIFLQISSFLIPVSLITTPFLLALKSFEKVAVYSFIVNVGQSIVKILFLVGLILIGLNSLSIPMSYVLGWVFVMIVSYFAFKYYVPGILTRGDIPREDKKKIAREVFYFSLPVLFNSTFGALFTWLDTFALGFFRTTAEVGIYNVAIPIAAMLVFVPDIFLQIFNPVITKEYSKGNMEVVKETSKQVAKWIFAFNLPILLIIVLFPGAVINILFGEQYLAAMNSLRILSIGMFFTSFMSVSNNLLTVMGKTKTIFYNYLAASVFDLILNLLLVQRYGMVGVALSTLASCLIVGVLATIQVKRLLGFVIFRRKMITILFVSLIPTALLLFIDLAIKNHNLMSLALFGILFFVMYFALILITSGFDKNDIFIMKTIMKKARIPGSNYLFGKK